MKIVKPEPTPTPNILLYGGPGTGKTTGAVSGPGPVLLMATEPKNRSRFAHMRYGDKLTEARIESLRDLMDATIEAEDGELAGDAGWGTIVVDSMAELHRVLMDDQSSRALRPSLPTYGDVQTHISRFTRALCDLESVVVFITHEIPIENRAEGEIEMWPNMGTSNPAPGGDLMKLVDLVGYTAKVEDETTGDPRFVAQLVTARGRRGKSLPGLGDFEEIDIEEWVNRIAAAGWAPLPKVGDDDEPQSNETEEVAA